MRFKQTHNQGLKIHTILRKERQTTKTLLSNDMHKFQQRSKNTNIDLNNIRGMLIHSKHSY